MLYSVCVCYLKEGLFLLSAVHSVAVDRDCNLEMFDILGLKTSIEIL